MGIVPNRSGSPQGVLQALWRNLFRSNPFHFGSADEADGWLTPARPSSTWSPLPAASPRISARCPGPLRGSTFQGGGKTRPSGWSVFALPSIEEEAVRVGSDPSDRSVAANVLLRQEPDEEEEEEDSGTCSLRSESGTGMELISESFLTACNQFSTTDSRLALITWVRRAGSIVQFLSVKARSVFPGKSNKQTEGTHRSVFT